MKRVKEGKQFNLSGLEGVYDVTIHKASPAARRQRWAKKTAPQPAKVDSQMYDDARERAKEYGAYFDKALPNGFFD
jgi:hypothetical protein